jgi:hypothetical protein
MKTIKKYASRKLYDTHDKRYISKERVRQLIDRGEDVTVIDSRTKKDITSDFVSRLVEPDSREKECRARGDVILDMFTTSTSMMLACAHQVVGYLDRAVKMAEHERNRAVKDILNGDERGNAQKTLIGAGLRSFRGAKRWISERIGRKRKTLLVKLNLVSAEDIFLLTKKIDSLYGKLEDLEREKKCEAGRMENRHQ